jgi:glyoxylase-like metal-dependent hydrolase (beta-lactamase superfamily II)
MRGTIAALTGAMLLTCLPASAQAQDFAKVEIKTTDLGGRMYMLEGQGGNITVAVADDGIIIVDTEFEPLHDKIKAAIAKLSSAPLRYAIDTHFHLDHSGGNAGFARDGAIVVAQETVKTRLMAGAAAGATTPATPAVSGAALPAKTYRTALTLRLKGLSAKLAHAAHAHTDGDTYVWFPERNVLSTGDTVSLGRYPNIDYEHGGSIRGMIAATDRFLTLVNGRTRIVPGHGPAGDKAALAEYRAMLIATRDRMAKLVKAGKTEDEAVAARPFADYDAKFAVSDALRIRFVRVMYHAVKGG